MLDLTYEKVVHLDKWDIDVVPYLNISTIADIVNDLVNCDNGLERDLKLIADVLVACTDIYNGEKEVHYTYEDILYSGFWDDLLDACPILRTNIETIYREVGDYLGLNKSLIHLIDSLTHVVESVDVSKFDFSQIDMEQINELVKMISDKVGEK
jgi:hypothetical protein